MRGGNKPVEKKNKTKAKQSRDEFLVGGFLTVSPLDVLHMLQNIHLVSL